MRVAPLKQTRDVFNQCSEKLVIPYALPYQSSSKNPQSFPKDRWIRRTIQILLKHKGQHPHDLLCLCVLGPDCIKAPSCVTVHKFAQNRQDVFL